MDAPVTVQGRMLADHQTSRGGRLGDLVRARRAAAGFSQRQLASAAGMSLAAVRDLEQGRTAAPRPQSLEQLAAALRVSGRERAELFSAWSAAMSARRAATPGRPHRSRSGIRELHVDVLGPLRASRDGMPLALGSVRQRAVLGLLALQAGTSLHRAAIVDGLWAGDPPPTSVAMVQGHVSRIRRILGSAPGPEGGDPLSWDGSGYRLSPGCVRLDLAEFDELSERARRAAGAGEVVAACGLYEAALAVWQGRALEDIEVLRGHPAVTGLDRRRAATVIDYARVAAGSGLIERLIPHLEALAAWDSLDERVHAHLIDALAATGNQAAALRLYLEVAARLDRELGISPGPELSAAHQQILRPAVAPASDAAAAVPASADARSPRADRAGLPGCAVPLQLPPAVPRFAGRSSELAVLASTLDRAAGEGSSAVIIAITGSAGIGKTALAVHWAHHVADRFPDGQLHVDLRGFGPAGRAVTAAEAVRQFLEGLGVTPDRIPVSLDAQAALYRSLLAGRRVLIVLDNARDAGQVRPLLPASPASLALITSRNQLTGLLAADGAHVLTLDVLSQAEAQELLVRRLGRARLAAQPAAVAETITLCARLPLALSITAARAVAGPDRPFAVLAAELRGAQDRLNFLDAGDAATDVRTVFSWSCQQLSGPAARMFRFLGLHSGPDITAQAAASLAGVISQQGRQSLAELVRAHLITEQAPGRYAFHDLLRVYAAEQCMAMDSDTRRTAALERVLDYYLHAACAASGLIHPYRDPLQLDRPQPHISIQMPADAEQALEWFRAERQVLLAAIGQAADSGFSSHAWQLSWALAPFLDGQGFWHELTATQACGLAAAVRQDDRTGQAQALAHLGRGQIRLGQYAEAGLNLARAVELGRQLGNDALPARMLLDLARVRELQGSGPDALRHAEEALSLNRTAGHRPGEANALNACGWYHAQLGRFQEAIDYCEQALALHRDLGYGPGEADALDSLGYAHRELGHYAEAVRCAQQAVEAHAGATDRRDRAEFLVHLGDAHQAEGSSCAARAAWQQALTIFDDLHHPDAHQVRRRLSRHSGGN
jgi:DNA-binding SARP family transcriptional activator/tetratricopeptide (TPR) repeat protein